MGNYNPHAPVILGQQWVPIRDEEVSFSPIINSVEKGTSYRQGASSTLADARFYLTQLPSDAINYQVAQVNLYPYGLESNTGPIQQVLIPCKSVTVTGSGISLVGVSGADYAGALYQPGDAKYVTFAYTGLSQLVSLWFDVSSYPVLANKRILNVSLAYSGSVQDQTTSLGQQIPIDFVHPLDGTSLTYLVQMNDLGSGQGFLAPYINNNTGTLSELNTVIGSDGTSRNHMDVAYVDLGDINNCWDTTNLGGTEKLPWRYTDLLRFEPGYGAGRQQLQLSVAIPLTPNGFPAGTGNDATMTLDYAALRVTYCEERRVAYGGQQFAYSYGMNKVTMRDTSQTANPTIPAGAYTPTLSFVSIGQVGFGGNLNSDFPDINADRQLYELPSHPGVEIDIPFPLSDHLGETFTKQSTSILPQLSLHSGTGPLTDPHVYGRQAAAQVWGAQTATQLIYDDISGVAASYPQVRYYARRFGNTTVPLTLTGTGTLTGSTASISVTTFDALPEILDGWREVTLRFTNAPSMGAVTGNPGWTWSATNEFAGNRWEVLGASAPAISGVSGTYFTQVPSPNQLGAATYQPTAGATAALTWMPQGIASTWVTGMTLDAATDAALMFSQDPATITGVSLSQLTQSVSGIGSYCGGLPCCIPSGIGYHQITWPRAGQTTTIRDAFNRTVATGLGNPDTGTGPYVLTDVGSAYSVNGSEALLTPSSSSTDIYATLDVGSPDFDITATVGVVGSIVAGSSARTLLVGRFTSAASLLSAFIQQTQSTGAIVLAISGTALTTTTVYTTIDAGGRVNMRFMGSGTLLKAKVWPIGTTEPPLWQLEVTEAVITTGNRAGIGAQSRTVAGNVIAFDNLQITSPSYWFGAYELQRYDSLAGDFQSIMLSTDITQVTFKDYEARIGVAAVYRIRALNAYNFAGLWSTYVTGTPASPGVTGGCSDMTGALIFTSNADQTGANNAAYAMQWDGVPNENFDLPEGQMVQFQPMYGRDGSVAFHGTERGLEAFSRTVLLQQGAIALPSLADATTIRDLAWAQLPYVCVRDHRGNRWFSNVRVPSASARNDAQNYMARLDITETTRTPYPVDP